MKHAISVITLLLVSVLSSAQVAPAAPPPPPTDTSRLTDDRIFAKVEIESEFPGGDNGWLKYLTENFKYPKAAIRKRIQGTVIVQFIVDKQGKVTDAQVIQSVHSLLDKEALRLIKESPNWKPAIQDGRPVRSYKKQPVV